jgi:hypothetical protein
MMHIQLSDNAFGILIEGQFNQFRNKCVNKPLISIKHINTSRTLYIKLFTKGFPYILLLFVCYALSVIVIYIDDINANLIYLLQLYLSCL